jgi:hypothetical protein
VPVSPAACGCGDGHAGLWTPPTFELKAARLAESPACVGVAFRRTRGPLGLRVPGFKIAWALDLVEDGLGLCAHGRGPRWSRALGLPPGGWSMSRVFCCSTKKVKCRVCFVSSVRSGF